MHEPARSSVKISVVSRKARFALAFAQAHKLRSRHGKATECAKKVAGEVPSLPDGVKRGVEALAFRWTMSSSITAARNLANWSPRLLPAERKSISPRGKSSISRMRRGTWFSNNRGAFSHLAKWLASRRTDLQSTMIRVLKTRPTSWGRVRSARSRPCGCNGVHTDGPQMLSRPMALRRGEGGHRFRRGPWRATGPARIRPAPPASRRPR